MAAPTPNAIDSPAEPAVWTTLFSRMVARRMPNTRDSPRKIVIASTATGIEAETVIETLRKRYSDEAPKMMPRTDPSSTAETVNSGRLARSGTYDRKAVVPGSPGVSATEEAVADMYGITPCERARVS